MGTKRVERMKKRAAICKCGSEMEEYTRFRSVPVYCCFDCFDFEKKTGMFFCDLD